MLKCYMSFRVQLRDFAGVRGVHSTNTTRRKYLDSLLFFFLGATWYDFFSRRLTPREGAHLQAAPERHQRATNQPMASVDIRLQRVASSACEPPLAQPEGDRRAPRRLSLDRLASDTGWTSARQPELSRRQAREHRPERRAAGVRGQGRSRPDLGRPPGATSTRLF